MECKELKRSLSPFELNRLVSIDVTSGEISIHGLVTDVLIVIADVTKIVNWREKRLSMPNIQLPLPPINLASQQIETSKLTSPLFKESSPKLTTKRLTLTSDENSSISLMRTFYPSTEPSKTITSTAMPPLSRLSEPLQTTSTESVSSNQYHNFASTPLSSTSGVISSKITNVAISSAKGSSSMTVRNHFDLTRDEIYSMPLTRTFQSGYCSTASSKTMSSLSQTAHDEVHLIPAMHSNSAHLSAPIQHTAATPVTQTLRVATTKSTPLSPTSGDISSKITNVASSSAKGPYSMIVRNHFDLTRDEIYSMPLTRTFQSGYCSTASSKTMSSLSQTAHDEVHLIPAMHSNSAHLSAPIQHTAATPVTQTLRVATTKSTPLSPTSGDISSKITNVASSSAKGPYSMIVRNHFDLTRDEIYSMPLTRTFQSGYCSTASSKTMSSLSQTAHDEVHLIPAMHSNSAHLSAPIQHTAAMPVTQTLRVATTKSTPLSPTSGDISSKITNVASSSAKGPYSMIVRNHFDLTRDEIYSMPLTRTFQSGYCSTASSKTMSSLSQTAHDEVHLIPAMHSNSAHLSAPIQHTAATPVTQTLRVATTKSTPLSPTSGDISSKITNVASSSAKGPYSMIVRNHFDLTRDEIYSMPLTRTFQSGYCSTASSKTMSSLSQTAHDEVHLIPAMHSNSAHLSAPIQHTAATPVTQTLRVATTKSTPLSPTSGDISSKITNVASSSAKIFDSTTPLTAWQMYSTALSSSSPSPQEEWRNYPLVLTTANSPPLTSSQSKLNCPDRKAEKRCVVS